MRIKLRVATAADVADLVSLRASVNQHLITQFGKGYWAAGMTEKGVLFAMNAGTVYLAKDRHRLIATLTLSTRKPWAIDTKYFHASKQPLYLTSMAVHPGAQGTGVGRLCLDQACEIAEKWPGDAIRLDAYDVAAGAGEFYRKYGFHEVGRATYRNSPLIYFELLLPRNSTSLGIT